MIDLSKFAENFSAYMDEKQIKAPALAKLIKTDRSNLTRYKQGKRLPSFPVFIAILEFFNVSADVLLGRKDYVEETAFLPVPPFGERLRSIMAETKTTQYRIEQEQGISGSSMYNWLNGIALPSIENLDKLASFMDVSIDYLLGRIR